MANRMEQVLIETIKREDGTISPPPSNSSTTGNRDHLRALLDRARGSRGAARQQSVTSVVEIKPEFPPPPASADTTSAPARIISLKSKSNRPEPPANLLTPRRADKTPLLPLPSATPSPVHAQPSTRPRQANIQGGLLPTPNVMHTQTTLQHSPQPTLPSPLSSTTDHSAVPVRYEYDSVPMDPHAAAGSVVSNHHVVSSMAPLVYGAPPVGSHTHTCSCAHAYPVPNGHSHGPPPDEYAMRWHYQAHPPPTLMIPAHYHHQQQHIVDSSAIAHAVEARVDRMIASSISPTMSTTTTSTVASTESRHSHHHATHTNAKAARLESPSTASTPGSAKPAGGTKRKMEQPTERKSPSVKSQKPPRQTAPSEMNKYEDHELHSDFVHAVHMLIPEDSFGCLVGPRGQIMKSINAATACTLSVREPQTFPMIEFDSVLRMYGKPKGICEAQRLVIERIRKFRAQKKNPQYIHLDGETLAPLDEDFVTAATSDAVKSDDEEMVDTVALSRDGQLKWVIPNDAVGRIMGSEGVILKAIARDTNTTLKVSALRDMARGSTERTVTIRGEPDDVEAARAVIEKKAGGRPETHGGARDGKAGQYFVLPQHAAGYLIGTQGARIRQIREQTGARIQIPAQQEIPLGYVNRTLHIQGNRQQIGKACALIRRQIQSFLGTAEGLAAEEEDEIALQLVLPTRICSFLLDQRGRLIREISDKAGAHARVLPPLDDEHRICVLYGDMDKVLRAQRLVLQFVAGDAIANKRTTAGGSLPRKRKRANNRSDDEEQEEEDHFESQDEDDIDDDEEEEEDDDEDDPPVRRERKRHATSDRSGRVVVHYSETSARNNGRSSRQPRRGGGNPPGVLRGGRGRGRPPTYTNSTNRNQRRR